jgi:lipoic acid synthetase
MNSACLHLRESAGSKRSNKGNRLPFWFRQELPQDTILARMRFIAESKVKTVCREAKCPNFSGCLSSSKLTFMILGDTCTRNCRFCAVKKSRGKPLDLDAQEGNKIKKIVEELRLRYVVITSVTRDDLADGGAAHFSRVIRSVRRADKDIKVELLIPDFKASVASLKCVLEAAPDVVAHNIETVKRLYPLVRKGSDYALSLRVLGMLKELEPSLLTKSSLMLGLGEHKDEAIGAMKDLRSVNCDILTLGQYLAPSSSHYPVKEFIKPEVFHEYEVAGLSLGFKHVLSGPLVRSSYKAEESYLRSLNYA